MKKITINFILLLIINIVISVYAEVFRVSNVLPAIYVILLVAFSANYKMEESVISGFFIGIMCDIFSGSMFGYNALIFMWLALLINFIIRRYFSNETIVVFIITIMTTFLYEFINYILLYLFQGRTYFPTFLLKIVVPEIIYTIVIFYPVYRLFVYYKTRMKKAFRF